MPPGADTGGPDGLSVVLIPGGAGPISNGDDDHQPTPAVSCTSINARCATLGASGSTSALLVIEDAGRANASAKSARCRKLVLDLFIP
jgi:hypothetical protein